MGHHFFLACLSLFDRYLERQYITNMIKSPGIFAFFVFLLLPQAAFALNAFECGLVTYIGLMQLAVPFYLFAQAILSLLLFFFLLKKKAAFKKPLIISLRILYLLLGFYSLAAFLFFLWGESAAQALPSLQPIVLFPGILIFGYTWLWLLLSVAIYASVPLFLHKKGYLSDRQIQVFAIVLVLSAFVFIITSGTVYSNACIEPDGKGM